MVNFCAPAAELDLDPSGLRGGQSSSSSRPLEGRERGRGRGGAALNAFLGVQTPVRSSPPARPDRAGPRAQARRTRGGPSVATLARPGR